MKQVKIVDVKKALNLSNNNDLVSFLMSNLINSSAFFDKVGDKTLKKIYDNKWDKLYNLLDEVGYFDDCKKVVDK